MKLNESNGWRYEWNNLAKTKADGAEITYTVAVTDDSKSNYVTTTIAATVKKDAIVAVDGVADFKFNNTSPAKTHFEVTKAIDGREWKDGETFTFTLATASDAPMPTTAEATASKSNQKAVFGDITYEKAGTYQYTITEKQQKNDLTYDDASHHVTVTVNDDEGELKATVKYDTNKDALTITNKYETVDIPVTKTWVDTGYESKRPESITVQLLANRKVLESAALKADGIEQTDNLLTQIVKRFSAVLNKNNDWRYIFESLPKYDENHELITYAVQEVAVTGYTGSVKKNDDGSFVITNTYVPESTPETKKETEPETETTTVPETTAPETTTEAETSTVPETETTTVPETTRSNGGNGGGSGGGGGGEWHAVTTAATTEPSTEEITTAEGGDVNGDSRDGEVETNPDGSVRGAGRGRNKNGDDGDVNGARRGALTGDQAMTLLWGAGFMCCAILLFAWVRRRKK